MGSARVQPSLVTRPMPLSCASVVALVLRGSGCVKIGDFGLSIQLKDEFLSASVGTPEFMAPEMFNTTYNESVDIYALGMCVVEMFMKRGPFSELTTVADLLRVAADGVAPPEVEALHLLWPEGYAFVMRCMQGESEEEGGAVVRLAASELLADPFLEEKAEDKHKPTPPYARLAACGAAGAMVWRSSCGPH